MTRRGFKRRRPTFEAMEKRDVPATWGIPWADPQHLTLSFAPDGTAVGSATSQLSSTLDADVGAGNWQATILRAVQTWASTANINVGLVADGGQPIGSAGPAQGDSRFGDIRISMAPLSAGTLAITSPYDPTTGTLSGDMILNSNIDFNPADAGSTDLYTVALHEAGHIFGFADSSSPSSFMYNIYNGPVTGLAPGAAAAMQALYGAPSPLASEVSTASFQANPAAGAKAAIKINANSGAPQVVSANLASSADLDVFQYQPSGGFAAPNGVDVQVRTGGLSLFTPTVNVYDSSGDLLGSSASAGPTAGLTSIHLNSVNLNSTYYVTVGGSADAFGQGSFQLSFGATGAVSAAANTQGGSLQPQGPKGSPLIGYGTISATNTSTLFNFSAASTSGTTVVLSTAGVGIGTPLITVYDNSMKVVAQASGSAGSNSVSLALPTLVANAKYSIGVVASTTTSLGFGTYTLQVGTLTTAPAIGTVVAGGQAASATSATSLAHPLSVPNSATPGARIISALPASASQADFQVQAPSGTKGQGVLLTATAISLDGSGVVPTLSVFDNKGNLLASQVISAGNGVYALQVATAGPLPAFIIQVSGPAGWGGGFELTAGFGGPIETTQTSTATATATTSATATSLGASWGLSVDADNLVRLGVASGNAAIGETMTITDASGNIVGSMVVGPGQTGTLTILLGPGTYTVQVTVVPSLGALVSTPVTLTAAGLDDPIRAYGSSSGGCSTTVYPM